MKMPSLSNASMIDNSSSYANNSSSNQDLGEESEPLLPTPMIAVLSLIGLLAVVINGVVIFLMFKRKVLRSLTNVFLASLALSDLVTSLFGIPVLVACLETDIFKICVVSRIFYQFTAVSSICHVLLVAFDRFLAIVHPLKRNSLVTKRRAVSAILFIWLLSFLTSTVRLSWEKYDDTSSTNRTQDDQDFEMEYNVILICFFFVVPFITMCSIYGHIFYISFMLARRDRRLNSALRTESRSTLHEWRGRSLLVIMMVIFVGCWLPFFLSVLGDSLNNQESSTSDIRTQRLLVVLAFIPPLLNPLLCTLAKKDFRRVLRELICKQKYRQQRVHHPCSSTSMI